MKINNIFLILLTFSSCAIGMEPLSDEELSSDDEALIARGREFIHADFNEMMAQALAEQNAEHEQENHQYELNEQLMNAMWEHDLEAARELIAAGADMHYVRDNDCWHNTFYIAIGEGQLEMCELFIASGAEVNRAVHKHFPTALFYARDHVVGKLLLDNKADIHKDPKYSALQRAACNRAPLLCELYIKAGADVHFTNLYRIGPLGSAYINKDMPTCQLLAEKMLTIPTENQKKRMYCLLGYFKHVAKNEFTLMYNKDIRRLIIRTIIREENMPKVLEQIGDEGAFKDKLLSHVRAKLGMFSFAGPMADKLSN